MTSRGEPRRSGPSSRRRAESREEELLAPYAARSAGSRRRRALDPEGRAFDYRTEFQRDRDRIIHARAFRRLQDKGGTSADPHRTWQNHALEVSQIGRTMARALCLNEDLVEATALAHDLGRPPLGDAGIAVLEELPGGALRLPALSPSAFRDIGGFDVPSQGLRVVDQLEKRYPHPGLNLTDEVRAGIWKQLDPCREHGYPDEDREGLFPGAAPSPEAQVVRVACRIARRIGELDESVRNRSAPTDRVEKLALLRELLRKLGDRYRAGGSLFMRSNQLHRGLTHLLVTGSIRRSQDALRRWSEREKVTTPERFAARRGALSPDVVALPDRLSDQVAELEAFLAGNRRSRREWAVEHRRARRMIHGLFQAYHADPATLEDYVLLRFRDNQGLRYLRDVPAGDQEQEIEHHYRGSRALARAIVDHLAGMTDRYLSEEHGRLCSPG